MRCGTGAWILPPAAMVSITSEPESEEVTKNTITRTMPMKLEIAVSGSCDSIWNSCSSSAASVTPEKPASVSEIAVPPKAVIHRTEISEGTISTAVRNCRTVRPRETRAMNMPTKGDQLIHQAQ
jgi:hypothetical protein